MITLGIQIDNAVHKINAHGFYFEDQYCVINCIKGESIINAYQLVLGCTADKFDLSKMIPFIDNKKPNDYDIGKAHDWV